MQKNTAQRFADTMTRWVGSLQSVVTHTVIFALSFGAVFFGWVELDRMLLVLTTIVSLEAIYLAIFIQMTINEQAKDIDEIQEDIGEIQEDVDEIQEDVEEMQEDVEELHEEEKKDDMRDDADHRSIEEIHLGLQKLVKDVEALQKR